MFCKRLAAAVFMVAVAFLFRLCMPEQYAVICPLIQEVLTEEQIRLPDMETVEAWFIQH